MHTRRAMFLLLAASLMSACGYHQIQADDEQVQAAASELIALSRRRMDQVPNLVQVVQTYAPNERAALRGVAVARDATAAHMPTMPESLGDRDALLAFSGGNQALSQAVDGLLAVSENYPALKADAGFRDIQAQMEEVGTRLDAAERRYVETVRVYNAAIGSLPNRVTAMFMGAGPKGEFR